MRGSQGWIFNVCDTAGEVLLARMGGRDRVGGNNNDLLCD